MSAGYFERIFEGGGRPTSIREGSHRLWRRRSLALVGLLGAVAPVLVPNGSSAAPVGQGFTVTPSDLSHILRQIKIAEHHVAATTPATGPCGALVGPGADQISNPLVADGLRTVDGTCTNLVSGNEKFGAEGVNFPRLTTPEFTQAEARPPGFFGPGDPGGASPTSYVNSGSVFDSHPRTISNLIVDQSSTNPAAVAAAHSPSRSQDPNGLACAQVNEVQSIAGTPGGADFTVTFGASTTGPIAAGATAADIDAALDAIVPGGVNVVGGPLPDRFVITFNGTPEDVAPLTTNDAALTVSILTEGVPPTVGADSCAPPHATLFIENITTDVGLSPPFNSLFTIFGQFFDHGVDKTAKPGSTVFIPLKADDPLVAGPDHVLGNADDLPEGQRFMPLTRAAKDPNGPNNIFGDADDDFEAINTDTPFVDQSQTYTSHPSHQVFLREYSTAGPDLVAGNADDRLVATGRLINGHAASGGVEGGQANWAEVKAQAASLLGLQLRDRDVLDIPMLATDAYGNFLPGPNGLPQYMTATGLVEGNLTTPVEPPADVLHFSTAFLDDIAHTAVPRGDLDGNPATPGAGFLNPDPDTDIRNNPNPVIPCPSICNYDDELLAKHFIAGDGRVNENIALTAVHQMFHSEHNRLINQDITDILNANPALKAQYQDTNTPAEGAAFDPVRQETFEYGERLFQASRFITEMEYQHLVFEEFARKVQPLINPFAGFAFTQANINPAVKAEFAHAVYRFGHSMLTDSIQRVKEDASGAKIHYDISLLDGFLNPEAYDDDGSGGTFDADAAAGGILMGLSDDAGNEIDEFVTETLRNNLLGLPLDLPSINMTRARSEGIPSLNDLRRQIYATTNDSQLQPYTDWVDFGLNLKHPDSLVNFVAAYGRHPSVLAEDTLAGKREAARLLVNAPLPGSPADASDFMNGTGTWAGQETGLNNVDLWMGGLAERTNLFGGLLGSTFNYVFEAQLTDLQNSDRLYYLGRTPGMNLRQALEGNSFAELVMRNTTAHSLKADAFATADCKFELTHFPTINDPFTGNTLVDDLTSECDESKVLIRMSDKSIRYRTSNTVDPPGINGQSVFNGTALNDRIYGGVDNDTFLGNEGDDVIEGGDGADVALGGEGNDRITDFAGDDVHKGGPGNDVIETGPGLDIIMGGTGKDFMNGGANINEIFGGPGDDFMILGQGEDAAQGDGGDDWMEGGDQPDLLQGDSGTLFFTDRNSPGHDVTIGQAGDDDYDVEGGDDIMIADPGIEKNAGSAGFDWSTGSRDPVAQNADLNIKFLPGVAAPQPAIETRDKFNEVEALSGGSLNDTLKGDDVIPSQLVGGGFIGCDALDQASLDRISGLDPLVPALTVPSGPIIAASVSHECNLVGNVWGEGNIILGGAGADTIEGRGADDIIDGDSYLDVRLSIRANADGTGAEIGTTDLMEHTFQAGNPKTLERAAMDGDIDPGQIVIVREILSPANTVGADRAVFSDLRANYDVTLNLDGSVTVNHARGTAADGVDTLWNVELLQFADITIPSTPGGGGGGNAPATGTPVITGTAQVGLVLTASNGDIADADGIASITFTWQQLVAGNWGTVATGSTFIPGPAQAGSNLRVVATVLDNLGGSTNLASAATSPVDPGPITPVNTPATGTPVITDVDAGAPLAGRPRVNSPLGVDLSGINDVDGLAGVTFGFVWQQSADGTTWADIPGATASTFTPTTDQLGLVLRVRVFFTDQGGSLEQLDSAATRDVRPARGRRRGVTEPLALARVVVPATLGANAATARGVTVGFVAPAGARVVRVQIFAAGNATASLSTAKRPLYTTYVTVKAGKRNTFVLKASALKRVLRKGGRFRVELTPGTSRTAFGAVTRRMIVIR